MINISSVIKEIVEEDEAALQMLRAKMLNLSSFARSIHKKVEERSFKKVEVKSLIVALSRLAKQYSSEEDKLQLKLENLAVHTNLVDLSFEKTKDNLVKAEKLVNLFSNEKTFFTYIQGITEITVIVDEGSLIKVKEVFKGVTPLSEITELAGITVKTDIKYTKKPGVFYELVRSLKMKKLNIIEIVSTSGEITFIINNIDIQATVAQLSKFLA